jgi:leucyl aminopeptidase
MKTTLSFSTPAEIETESLVAIALDQSAPDQSGKDSKDKKPQLALASSDAAVQSAAADLLASGELTGRSFETNLLHKPSAC